MEQKKTLRRAAAVQDLSGFGRCSLTVALPILSAMGVQCSCLPTAVLSTHTGGFKGYTFRDLTEDMEPFFRHWQKEQFTFDALYTGYLGSLHQLEIVQRFFDAFQTKENITLVDACMTRLRVTVKDLDKVADVTAWKAEGALGLIKKDNGIQAVYGPKADVLKSDINDIL